MAPTPDDTDASLLARVAAGDEGAFRILCDRYQPLVAARVRRRLTAAILRKMSVSDVVQEAHFAAFQRIEDFDERGQGSFGAWLAAIADNKALQVVRRFHGTAKRGAQGELSRGVRADTQNFPGCSPSPSEHAMGREMGERVRCAMAALGPDQREVIELRQRQHLTIAETAERMGRSSAAVKMLYGRALTRLAALLELEEGVR